MIQHEKDLFNLRDIWLAIDKTGQKDCKKLLVTNIIILLCGAMGVFQSLVL